MVESSVSFFCLFVFFLLLLFLIHLVLSGEDMSICSCTTTGNIMTIWSWRWLWIMMSARYVLNIVLALSMQVLNEGACREACLIQNMTFPHKSQEIHPCKGQQGGYQTCPLPFGKKTFHSYAKPLFTSQTAKISQTQSLHAWVSLLGMLFPWGHISRSFSFSVPRLPPLRCLVCI